MRRVARLRTQRIRGRTSAWLDRSIQALIWKLRYDRFGSIAVGLAVHWQQGEGASMLITSDSRHFLCYR